MISLAMLAIMAGCAAGLYFKGTLALGITMVFDAIVAGLVAFGFFEFASKYLIQYASGVAPWAPMICFLTLLLLVFALLQAIQMQLSKEKIDLGVWPERIGRPAAGVVLGYLVTGYLLVAAAMGPLPNEYPYPRFDARNPNPTNPHKAMLSPDGFVTGLFSTASKGGFGALSEPHSFALFHAGFLDQLYLNRHQGKDVALMTSTSALDVPRKAGVWHAPDSLRDAEGKPVSGPAGTSLMLVRVGIKKAALKDATKFTLAQMRLVCGLKTGTGPALAGQGQAVYPAGCIGADGRFDRRRLDEIIDLSKASGDLITMDLGFHVPMNSVPVLLEFKRNNVVQVSAPATAEDAPQPIPFGTAAPDASAASPADQPPGAEPASQPPRNTRGRGSKAKNETDRTGTRARVERFTGPLEN
jgi:hypothetical protein